MSAILRRPALPWRRHPYCRRCDRRGDRARRALGGAFGAGVFGVSEALLPWGLAFAAGAMLFVVSHEIIPESHRRGHEAQATFGVMIGFVAMMLLDTVLAA